MLYLPLGLPAACMLQAKTYELNQWDKINDCERVLLLNLMPKKEDTEFDIARTLHATDLSLQIIPIKISGQIYKNTPTEYMEKFYLNFESVEDYSFERLIITGAPLEQIAFEDVRYWSVLCHIMDWADSHIDRTLYICWAAQAGLYHFYNIEKHLLNEKMFGVYSQKVNEVNSILMKGLCPAFPMPNSRHTEVREDEILAKCNDELQILASSSKSGVGILATDDLKRTFIVGHLEYAPDTLHNEYWRDHNKGLAIKVPENYYRDDSSIDYSWEMAAVCFYKNWLLV